MVARFPERRRRRMRTLVRLSRVLRQEDQRGGPSVDGVRDAHGVLRRVPLRRRRRLRLRRAVPRRRRGDGRSRAAAAAAAAVRSRAAGAAPAVSDPSRSHAEHGRAPALRHRIRPRRRWRHPVCVPAGTILPRQRRGGRSIVRGGHRGRVHPPARVLRGDLRSRLRMRRRVPFERVSRVHGGDRREERGGVRRGRGGGRCRDRRRRRPGRHVSHGLGAGMRF
mmetsp:Transcript_17425/g.41845  ORF Transcript_17425/g.41845 Transcript_17425/m.41845 type:complete len:222 (-) Transcript_17425:35-700(-)